MIIHFVDSDLLAFLCKLFYLAATLAVVVTVSFPVTRAQLVHYGKLLPLQTNEANGVALQGLLSRLLTLRVPKRWFTQFYAFGLAWFGLWTWQLAELESGRDAPLLRLALTKDLKDLGHGAARPGSQHGSPTVAATFISCFLLTIQMARRLWESLVILKPSDALMHSGHYLVGFAFYGCTGLAVWIEASGDIGRCLTGSDSDRGLCSWEQVKTTLKATQVIFGIALFFYASIQQYRSHRVLASLRKEGPIAGKPTYSLPIAGPFQTLDCPHYWFEILIYASLLFITHGKSKTLWYCVLWVVVNLGVTAGETRSWYVSKFGAEYRRMSRWRMIPFVW